MSYRSVLSVFFVVCFSPHALAQECGSCVRDATSATGFSQFCRFGPGMTGRLPCTPDDGGAPESSPPPVGAELSIATDDIPVCSDRQREVHDSIVTDALGASVSDVAGAYIRSYPAEHKIVRGKNNWYPNDVYKQTLCGKLQRFGIYDGIGAEMDWTLFMIPNPPFIHLFTDVVEFEGGITDLWDGWPKCGDVSACIEGEITPDERFYENPWFPKSDRNSPLEDENARGPNVCMYGPWIREWAHAYKPEIHPSEAIWWREPARFVFGTETWWFMQLDDDSNRFDRNSDYDFGWPWEDPEPGWQPWTKPPRQLMFNIPFRTSASNGTTFFTVSQAADAGESEVFSARKIVTPAVHVGIPKDDASDRVHRLRYNGSTIVQVSESDRIDADIAIGFLGLCRDAANTEVQGVLRLGTAVSEGDRGDEGYHVFTVNRSFFFVPGMGLEDIVPDPNGDGAGEPASPSEAVGAADRVITRAGARRVVEAARTADGRELRLRPRMFDAQVTAVSDSMDLQRVDGRRTLVGGFTLEVDDVEAVGTEEIASAYVLINGQRRELVFDTEGASTVSFSDVPVIGTEEISLVLASGKTVAVSTKGIALATVRGETLIEAGPSRQDEETLWQSISEAVTGSEIRNTQSLPALQRTNHIRVEAVPRYGPLIGGQVKTEDSSPWSARANEALSARSASERRRVFGSRRPVEAAWTFAAMNLTTGERVPVVRSSSPAVGSVAVSLSEGDIRDSVLDVRFPAEGDDIYTLVARVVMSDVFGTESSAVYRYSSHHVSVERGTRIEPMLAFVADLNQLETRNLMEAAAIRRLPATSDLVEFGSYPIARDPTLRRARMLNLVLRQSMEDERITIGELAGLNRLSQLYSRGSIEVTTPYMEASRTLAEEVALTTP